MPTWARQIAKALTAAAAAGVSSIITALADGTLTTLEQWIAAGAALAALAAVWAVPNMPKTPVSPPSDLP